MKIDKKQNGYKGNTLDKFGIEWILVEGFKEPFFIASTPVTFGQYDKFCDATGCEKPEAPFGRDKQPVINVNVDDAVAYCQWLSKVIGTTVRLPEENEWEYAAREGKKNRGYEYSGSHTIDDVAWYSINSGGKTHEVGTKKMNKLGIYDMCGNVWEWCGTSGAIRGGSWYSSNSSCQISYHSEFSPGSRNASSGFRIVKDK